MSRPIKFRSWDTKKAEFITDWDDGGHSLVEFHGDGFEVIQCYLCDEIVNGEHDQYENYRRILENVEIMQFTGLKDKNGKEVFEGDILSRGHIKTGYVSFDGGSFRMVINTPTGVRDYILGGESTASSEVLGNIQQTPELLTT